MSEEHRWIVDRFEGDLAVVEVDGDRFLDLPRWILPADAAEGDVIRVAVRTGGGIASTGEPTAEAEGGEVDGPGARRRIELRLDREATERARDEAGRLIDELRRRDPGGDVSL